PEQRVVVGTLGDLAAKTAPVDAQAPAVVIVGEVVALRERLRWFEDRPLRGKCVLVGRVRPGPSAIASELRGLGATVLEAPFVYVAPLEDAASLDLALTGMADYRGVIFGCATGVESVISRLEALGWSPGKLTA